MFHFLPVMLAAAVSSSPASLAHDRPPSCAPDRGATIARAAKPQYPPIAQLQNVAGTTGVRIDLSESGDLLGAYVAVSSGNRILDNAAIRAAQAMAYAPETRSCKTISGSYLVEVEFAS